MFLAFSMSPMVFALQTVRQLLVFCKWVAILAYFYLCVNVFAFWLFCLATWWMVRAIATLIFRFVRLFTYHSTWMFIAGKLVACFQLLVEVCTFFMLVDTWMMIGINALEILQILGIVCFEITMFLAKKSVLWMIYTCSQ